MIREYCEILVSLGKWERALAVAPSLSLPYWKSLSVRYADYLAAKGDNNAIPFLVATGEIEQVCMCLRLVKLLSISVLLYTNLVI